MTTNPAHIEFVVDQFDAAVADYALHSLSGQAWACANAFMECAQNFGVQFSPHDTRSRFMKIREAFRAIESQRF